MYVLPYSHNKDTLSNNLTVTQASFSVITSRKVCVYVCAHKHIQFLRACNKKAAQRRLPYKQSIIKLNLVIRSHLRIQKKLDACDERYMFYRSSLKRGIWTTSAKQISVFSSGTRGKRCMFGEGGEEKQDNIPVCLKLLGFLLLPSPGLLHALGLQGIITARK